MFHYNSNKEIQRLQLEILNTQAKLMTQMLELNQQMAATDTGNTVPMDFEALADIPPVTFELIKQKTGISFWKRREQLKLEKLLESVPSSIIQRAIGKYVSYYGKGGGDYPAALFCKVLENELPEDFDEAV